MNNRIKRVIMYVLVLVILFLICYLVYFAKGFKASSSNVSDVSKSCSRVMNMESFNSFNGDSNCSSINIILSDGKIGSSSVSVKYGSSDSGIYLGNKVLVKNASDSYKNRVMIIDNMLFIVSYNRIYTDVNVFDNGGESIFSLYGALNSSNVMDSVLGRVLTSGDIDPKSVTINNGSIVFNSLSKECNSQGYNGVSYLISFSGNNFSNISATGFVNCR